MSRVFIINSSIEPLPLSSKWNASAASAAVMLVHAFSPMDKWFKEYSEFAELFGIEARIGVLMETRARNGLPLFLGWVHGDERYLAA